ncbi:bacillithiol system protein YtxJ [Gracilibacillus halotolerans]|uniref:Bacillithiol system protein YtxJ n=1 Tax=Gracilibacillus halotolerans TaxID=74386 RepID=A0A841RHL4_9BACI|nr:bacillithiol system redox-active protein YtxJ [Gracilibacillus halotolerans]MBB6513670.1 bacillithiol system protein YtxJ [Gracilibacillus halotolerans]
MKINDVYTKEEFNEMTEVQNKYFLLKHSLTCPISANANEVYERFQSEANYPLYRLYVQKSQELSKHIEEEQSVKHESPQLLVFENGRAVANVSHYDITERFLQQHNRFRAPE